MTVTIRDLAKELELSPTTVSMVLNSAPLAQNIPDVTKKRVRAAAKRLGYTPNPFARYLRSNRSSTVAVLLSDITDPYCAQVLRGIGTSLYSSNYVPVVLDIQNSPGKFKRILQKLVERRIEGVIGVATSRLLRSALLATIKTHKIPMVLIGRDAEGTVISSVSVANEAGGWLAMKHLYELGHRRIAFLKGPKDNPEGVERWEGITRFARESGFVLDEKLFVQMRRPGTSYQAGAEAARDLLARELRFTALLAFDDLTAFGAIRVLTLAGRHIPRDCSVIGFDDIGAAAFYNPPLTTIRQPMESLGALAAEIFVDSADSFFAGKPFAPVHRKVKTQLVIRDSTARPQPALRISSGGQASDREASRRRLGS